MARPPSKRRRTDDAAVTADSIAQSNSTVQIFLGQRENRWMEGYAANEARAANGASANAPQDTRTARATTESTGSTQSRPISTANVPVQGPNVVSYVPPRLYAPAQPIPEMFRNPAAAAMAPDGTYLPSPAITDINLSSPGTRTQTPARATADPLPADYHGGVPTIQDHARALSGSQIRMTHPPPIVHQHSRQQLPTFSSFSDPPTAGPHNPSQPVPRAHARTSSATHPAASVPSQPPQVSSALEDDPISQAALLRKFEEFHSWVTASPDHKLSPIDHGRMRLLKDAIDREDLFCVALSQIHSLARLPELLPPALRGLNARSFQHCDLLVASTDLLTPVVLEWLRGFPLPLPSIFASPKLSAAYEPHIKLVAVFLHHLPQHWDRILSECKKQGAPPLVEDLYYTLHLPSPVFQSAAFRAIGRMFFENPSFVQPAVGLGYLERLHHMDQSSFQNMPKRNHNEKMLAYSAFREAREAYRQWEQRVQPTSAAKRRTKFLPFELPSSVVVPFLVRPNSSLHQRVLSDHPALQPAQTIQGPPQPPPASRANFVFPRDQDDPRPQPTNPEPGRSALHQAYLRSPNLGPIETEPGQQSLYRHVKAFAMSPTIIKEPMKSMSFVVTQEHWNQIATIAEPEKLGELPTRHLTENSRTYRLRCAPLPLEGFLTEKSWIEADNFWPDDLYLQFNDAILEPRRKLHHNRYLPIDLTRYIRVGQNNIQAIVNRTSTDTRPINYVLVVEIVGVSSHKRIRESLVRISAADSLASIKTSLTGGQDDDELSIISSQLTINLFDPFSSAKIFDLPVRGKGCAHKDCFDFESFLRGCKRGKPGWPTVVDCWRCPICRGDVRPYQLVIDGFLVQVRKDLEDRGLLETRAIVIDAEGKWKPKEEGRTGKRSASLEREELANSASSGRPAVPNVIEID